MKRFTLIGCAVVITAVLSACQQVDAPKADENANVNITGVTVQAPVAVEPTYEPYVFKTSAPDRVTIKGRLLVSAPWAIGPDPNDGIFLVPLSGDANIASIPQFTVGEVPQADVDERFGDFVFTNILPGQYAVVVLTTNGSQIPATRDDGSIAVLMINESDLNTTIDIGKLNFP